MLHNLLTHNIQYVRCVWSEEIKFKRTHLEAFSLLEHKVVVHFRLLWPK